GGRSPGVEAAPRGHRSHLRSEAHAGRVARAERSRSAHAGHHERAEGAEEAAGGEAGVAQEAVGEEDSRQAARGRQAPMIVAIYGPSGVGKPTTSKLVARALNLPHIDTGAMYRAVALAATRAGISTRDAEALERLASEARIEFIPGQKPRVLL